MSTAPRVLLLGSGRVAGPAINQLLDSGLALTVAGDDPQRAKQLVAAAGRDGAARIERWSAADGAGLDALLQDATVAISLLPPQWHVSVAERCLAAGVHLVTTSYVSDEMAALHQRAQQAGVVLLNEIGLDPGIDHLSAMTLIAEQRALGHELLAFRSLCGGLPAQRDANPWGYKLSWSPIGVLQAARSSARYREAGQLVQLDARGVCAVATQVEVAGVGTLERLANRDALPYAQRYGLEGIPTLYRATLRYPGWAAALGALHLLDLLAPEPPGCETWEALLAGRLPGSGPLARRARQRGLDEQTVQRLSWLGLFEPQPLIGDSVIEALAQRMLDKLSYEPGEQDLVVLRNELEVRTTEGRRRAISATLVLRGDACGESAMARTVGLPAALTAELLTQPELARRLAGVRIPVEVELYVPLMERLQRFGLGMSMEIADLD